MLQDNILLFLFYLNKINNKIVGKQKWTNIISLNKKLYINSGLIIQKILIFKTQREKYKGIYRKSLKFEIIL